MAELYSYSSAEFCRSDSVWGDRVPYNHTIDLYLRRYRTVELHLSQNQGKTFWVWEVSMLEVMYMQLCQTQKAVFTVAL